jgi:hypothetical protein
MVLLQELVPRMLWWGQLIKNLAVKFTISQLP